MTENGDAQAVLIAGQDRGPLDGVAAALRARGMRIIGPFAEGDLANVEGGADCAILDVSTGDRSLRRMLPQLCRNLAPLIVITSPADAEWRIDALRFGAADHVVTPFEVSEVVARVEALLARRRRARRGRLDVGDLTIRLEDRRAIRNGEDLALTPREFDILVTLMQASGRAVSKHELLNAVWHNEAGNVNVVEAHVSALRRKLDRTGPKLIHTVHRVGYAFRPARTSTPTTREALLDERRRLLRERDEAVHRRDEILAELRTSMGLHRRS